jgi:nitroimidazol reductase NimA-like FMN-containing flavoprotein (pyridoxamine 5'-phosphate oxidase superfamily)
VTTLLPTPSTTLRRKPDRGSHDVAVVNAILDEALICHVGFVAGDGRPVVIPTIHARDGDRLLIHGSPASRMLRSLAGGIDVCVTVTLVDGLVLARSAMHHSMNYRSVVVLGRAEKIVDRDDKLRALDRIVDHVAPGRSAEARPANELELRGTLVLEVPLAEASAKVRAGGPIDDDADLDLPVWAGVVPLSTVAGPPRAEPDLPAGVTLPAVARAPRTGWSRLI